MVTKNLQVTELVQDPAILTALWKHFQYSIRDIKSYQDLTEEEKDLIPIKVWVKITEPLKCYLNEGPGREIHVLSVNINNQTATVRNPDGSLSEIRLKTLVLDPAD